MGRLPELPPTGGGRGPTWGRQGLGGRERGPMTADMLRHVRRHGRTSAARRLFHHIRPLPYSVSCMAEGQSDPAEEEAKEKLTPTPQRVCEGRSSGRPTVPSESSDLAP